MPIHPLVASSSRVDLGGGAHVCSRLPGIGCKIRWCCSMLAHWQRRTSTVRIAQDSTPVGKHWQRSPCIIRGPSCDLACTALMVNWTDPVGSRASQCKGRPAYISPIDSTRSFPRAFRAHELEARGSVVNTILDGCLGSCHSCSGRLCSRL